MAQVFNPNPGATLDLAASHAHGRWGQRMAAANKTTRSRPCWGAKPSNADNPALY